MRNKGNEANSTDVQHYLSNYKGFMMALNRIEFAVQPVGQVKNLLHELIGKRAKSLGIVSESSTEPGKYEPTGIEFPKKLIDFLLFYKLLIILCKLCIAKHDENLIEKGIEKTQNQIQSTHEELKTLKMRISSLEDKQQFFVSQEDQVVSLLPDMEATVNKLQDNE